MTSPSDRITIRLTHDQAEVLRALAYEFHNTPTSLAGLYVGAGILTALQRGARLEQIAVKEYQATILSGLRLARELGMVEQEPSQTLRASQD